MSALAQFIMRGRNQAVLVVASFTILSWLLSVASLLASAALALPTLRRGVGDGLLTAALALPIVVLAGYWLMGGALEAAGFALVIWVPTLVVAGVLRESGQLGRALLSACGLGMAAVMVVYMIMDDPQAFWREQFQALLKPVLEAQMPTGGDQAMTLTLDLFARYATGAVSAGSVLSVMISLLIARWWQAGLFNPGGFRKEFIEMSLGKPASLVFMGAVGVLSFTSDQVALFLANLLLPAVMVYMLAGFSVIHGLCATHSSGRFWLTGLYVALMFMTPLILAIALVGVSDPWLGWRQRFQGATRA